MTFKDYRQQSRDIGWGTSGDSIEIEQINCGSLLRIADSVEKMAQNYKQLIDERDYLKAEKSRLCQKCARLERSVSALRGWVKRRKA